MKLFEIRILKTEGTLNVDISLSNKVCLLASDSGTGKTYAMSFVREYCIENDIRCTMVNYNDAEKSEDEIIRYCVDSDVVIFDDANLYLTSSIIDRVYQTSKIIVVCAQDLFGFMDCDDTAFYSASFTGERLEVCRH